MSEILHPNRGLTNAEMVEYLGLPQDMITKLQTAEPTEYEAHSNEFLSALVNKIVYQVVDSVEFTNPFKKYDSFPVKFGDTIENIAVELPRGYKYDRNATDPFGKKTNAVKTLYATINYEMQYETTVYREDLRRAVLSEYGLMNLTSSILDTLGTAMALDEYEATLAMLSNGDIYANGIEELSKGATDADTAKLMTTTIANAVSAMDILMTANNKQHYTTRTPKDRTLLVIKYDLLNQINFDYLAGVYNLSKVELLDNIIKVDSFQVAKRDSNGDIIKDSDGKAVMVGNDIDFAIIDTKGFDCHVALQDSGYIYNPKAKYTNYYSDLWKIIAYKTWFNARAFKLKDTTK
jgi:hypothetical protein